MTLHAVPVILEDIRSPYKKLLRNEAATSWSSHLIPVQSHTFTLHRSHLTAFLRSHRVCTLLLLCASFICSSLQTAIDSSNSLLSPWTSVQHWFTSPTDERQKLGPHIQGNWLYWWQTGIGLALSNYAPKTSCHTREEYMKWTHGGYASLRMLQLVPLLAYLSQLVELPRSGWILPMSSDSLLTWFSTGVGASSKLLLVHSYASGSSKSRVLSRKPIGLPGVHWARWKLSTLPSCTSEEPRASFFTPSRPWTTPSNGNGKPTRHWNRKNITGAFPVCGISQMDWLPFCGWKSSRLVASRDLERIYFTSFFSQYTMALGQ